MTRSRSPSLDAIQIFFPVAATLGIVVIDLGLLLIVSEMRTKGEVACFSTLLLNSYSRVMLMLQKSRSVK